MHCWRHDELWFSKGREPKAYRTAYGEFNIGALSTDALAGVARPTTR